MCTLYTHTPAAGDNHAGRTYLSFEGRCEEALNFYQQALGAQVGVLMRNKDAPPMEGGAPKPPEGCEPEGSSPGDKILHAAFTVGGSTSWPPTA